MAPGGHGAHSGPDLDMAGPGRPVEHKEPLQSKMPVALGPLKRHMVA